VPEVIDHIHYIFNIYITAGYNPVVFQQLITVVLRKGGDQDYREPRSYRPVALLNMLGKFLESIMARRLSYMVKTYSLLPPTHLDGCRGISTDHAIQILLDRIHRAWGEGLPVVSMALLDVTGVYDNTAHERLLHDLRRKGLSKVIPWVRAFLSDWSTRIRMP
jgi:hypothetical protein